MFIIEVKDKGGEHVIGLKTDTKGKARAMVLLAQENNLVAYVTNIPEAKEVSVKFKGIDTPEVPAPAPAETAPVKPR